MAGVLVKQWNLIEGEAVVVLDVTDVVEGMYVLRMETEEGMSEEKVGW